MSEDKSSRASEKETLPGQVRVRRVAPDNLTSDLSKCLSIGFTVFEEEVERLRGEQIARREDISNLQTPQGHKRTDTDPWIVHFIAEYCCDIGITDTKEDAGDSSKEDIGDSSLDGATSGNPAADAVPVGALRFMVQRGRDSGDEKADLEFFNDPPSKDTCVMVEEYCNIKSHVDPIAVAFSPRITHYARVSQLAVLSDYRKFGAGRKLMEAAEEFARTDLKQLHLRVMKLHGNLPALPFYKRIGYMEMGQQFMHGDVELQNLYKVL